MGTLPLWENYSFLPLFKLYSENTQKMKYFLLHTANKPEDDLLILPIILSEFPIIFIHSLFIPMLSPIILYYSSNLIVSLVKSHMAAAKIVYCSTIKIDNIINSS